MYDNINLYLNEKTYSNKTIRSYTYCISISNKNTLQAFESICFIL